MFSIPMLFFMGATSHFAQLRFDTSDGTGGFMGVATLLILVLEANALGLLGGTGQSPIRRYMESHRDTIIAGFVLAAILYVLFDLFF
jgi:hypothetical protein